MPTGNDSKGKLEIHMNGKVYDNFEEMFSDFVEEMVANEPAREETDNDQMAKELFATYKAFMNAGFDREQAFELLLTIISKED